MPTFSFEGFTIGSPVNLSATQGAETVNGSVQTWGQEGGTGSGTATIDIAQTDSVITQYDSVRFLPTGWADFDTPGTHAPSGNIYQPRMHDIVYLWDTGKTGDFNSPQNLLAAHKSRQYHQGPVCMVCFDTPGVHTVRLYAYEPSSGKYGIATTTVTVNSADSEFPGNQTICIRSNGGSAAGIPAGAQVYELDPGNIFNGSHPAWTSNRGGAKKRFLFEGGATFDIQITDSASNVTDGIMIGSYGTGKATTYRTSGQTFNFFGGWTEVASGVPKRALINNMRVTGNFDPTTHTGNTSDVVGTGGGTHLVVHNCEVDGIGGNCFILIGGSSLNTYFHLDDTVVTRIGGQYPIYTDDFTHPDNSCGITGCRVLRDPQSNFDEGFSGLNGQQRAPFRLNGHAYCTMQATEVFQNTGDQPCVKLAERGDTPGGIYTVHGCTLESAIGLCMRYKFNAATHVHSNLIFRQNILISGHSTTTFAITARGQGCSVDANLHLAPGTAAGNPEGVRSLVNFDGPSGGTAAGSPNIVRNNTSAVQKSNAENAGISNFSTVVDQGTAPDTIESDNIVYTLSAGSADSPLTDDDALFTLRNTGRYENGSFDTGWASSPNVARSFRPETGSSALGGGSASAFPFPIDAQTETDIRPSGAEDRGAWQGTA